MQTICCVCVLCVCTYMCAYVCVCAHVYIHVSVWVPLQASVEGRGLVSDIPFYLWLPGFLKTRFLTETGLYRLARLTCQ